MIAAQDLTKLYSNGKGVNNLTFQVSEGEVFGYLGPNGAGKTTTIRNLLGFLKPDSGSCTVNGLDCWVDPGTIQEKLGYIPGEVAFFDGMTGTQFLALLADMRGMKDRSRTKQLIDRFELDSSGKIKKMSKGMKQKVAIVAACMHDPPVMIFDEPSSGLDPLMQNRFVEFVAEEKNRGKTLLISSHSFEEINRTCDRAGIIREGVLVDVQDVHKLKEEQRRVFVVTVDTQSDVEVIRNTNFELGTVEGLRIEVYVEGSPNSFLKMLGQLSVADLEIRSATLEQVFMRYYGREELQ